MSDGPRAAAGTICPLPALAHTHVLLGHGSGGKLTSELIEQLFLPAFRNPLLEKLDDHAVFSVDPSSDLRIAFTTDSFVVNPIFFPGGDIGQLAVNGTVNDLAMAGAEPLYLSAGFILEEGFPMDDLRRVVLSMADASARAGVAIATGDTKVVQRGKADGLFINTTGVGAIRRPETISAWNARPGDRVLVSGPIGEHGMAIMLARGALDMEVELASDTAPLASLVQAMLGATAGIHCLKDPTRGGVATVLNEIAQHSGVGIVVEEEQVPVRDEVRGACEILGIDPLYVANEGKLLALVAPEAAPAVLAAMRAHPDGQEAALIGVVTDKPRGRVLLRTPWGGLRVLDMLVGDPLPRIC
ncbi:MAG: hydrogenase expression/formation protein HypE [Chloroflexi bacterium]|nr:hydrogenase expression/formation protein HypE [Chloroflexota bacterium]